MKKNILTVLALILALSALVCVLGFRQGAREAAASPLFPEEEAAATAAPATPAPTPTPVAEDPAQTAAMAWEALFAYPSHETPIRVLALLRKEGSPGDMTYRQMLSDGKLMAKGVYYAQAGAANPADWTAEALKAVPVGLLDSIYAETPELALAAYTALRKAERNDSVEVICAGVTAEVLAALQEDHFSMGAAAGVYENELRVVYAQEFLEK